LWLLKLQIRTLLRSRQWLLRRLDLNLLRNQKGIVDVYPKMPHGTLNLGVTQQELDGSEIACSSVDHLKQSPGFQGYYVFDAGGGVGVSVSLFESKETALAANGKAPAWIRGSLVDVINGEPEVTMGEVLTVVSA
jgi:hypothetical protein